MLPVQIYLWADSPERGFVSRTSAAIMVLLAFLVCMMNGTYCNLSCASASNGSGRMTIVTWSGQ